MPFSRLHQDFYLYLPAALYLPLLSFLTYSASQSLPLRTVLFLFLTGLLLWTFVEYLLHRFAFHHEAKSAFGKRVIYFAHIHHHHHPKETRRAHLGGSVPMALSFYALFRLLLPEAACNVVFSGMISGYLGYDAVHYILHHWPLEGRVGRFLKNYHMQHHYRDNARNFGVTTPFWDLVFGTRFRS